jgi:aquaporin Z
MDRRKYIAEMVGTFALVFAGCGAIVVNEISGGAITHVGISAAFGLVVLAMIYAIGDVSGAHLNPAVTVGFWISRRFASRHVLPYIASQLAGAISASLVLHLIFPESTTLGMTQPHVAPAAAFVIEALLTFFLVFVIMHVATGGKEKGLMAGIAIGCTVALDALVGGPVTGASMNPARSLAPAVVFGRLDGLWLYIAAPLVGSLAAVATWRITAEPAAASERA